ncbi:MAG TPA: DNA-formamidopyrimidine glycosylase family protein [Desulfuromonadales bacterium]|nr:DNA-formamidopyrimidine glycosylase family protein [Desulfuromonadales bacterium]
MPELPDVEIFRDYLQTTSLHQRICGLYLESVELVKGISGKKLRQQLEGRSFTAALRHGKYLFGFTDGGGSLVLHFGMTGFLRYYKKEEKTPAYLKLAVQFANGYQLGYDCRRKLGRIGWTEDHKRFIQSKGLGPDPLSKAFDRNVFLQLLDQRRGSIKGLLMNQQAMAGIGNVYSDEILFQIGIHPKRPAKDLRDTEKKQLYDTLREVLRTAIDRRVGADGWPDDWLLPHREPEAECPRCGGRIRRIKVSGRGAYCCGDHQD